MMPTLGAPELIIILVIIILIFGVGKLPEVGSAFGKGIREFRAASGDDDKDKKEDASSRTAAVEAPRSAPAVEAPRSSGVAEAARPSQMTYTIQTGDTLESVAQRHGVTIEALMQANGYSQRDRPLYAGDQIQIPRASTNVS